jgi:hypothetical protein
VAVRLLRALVQTLPSDRALCQLVAVSHTSPLAPIVLNLVRYYHLSLTLLEGHMLQKVRGLVRLRGLEPTAGVDPHSHGGRLGVHVRLTRDTQPVRQRRNLCLWRPEHHRVIHILRHRRVVALEALVANHQRVAVAHGQRAPGLPRHRRHQAARHRGWL